MKIRTRLRLNAWISLGVLLVVLLSFAWNQREAVRLDRNVRLTETILTALIERISLRDEYLLYREDRVKAQWMAKSSSVSELLDLASRSFHREENRALVVDARRAFASTMSIFEDISREPPRAKGDASMGYSRGEADSRLISQLLLKAYAMTDDIRRLHENSRASTSAARIREILTTVALLFAGVIALLVNSALLERVVSRRLAALHAGIEIIGAGELEHRIDTAGNDEFSELARSGNEMAARLKASHTSVENLRREIQGREQAEERIRILNGELEERVAERTGELQAKTAELERMNRVFVDRELRMRELKERIALLEGSPG